ncbi:hypothetical protein [Kribbella sp. NPDC048928]|uniref:hypothetical protein n=1 Tax=Kribbella sp. NPDC048928 TaxID=3364111 RepID=UPI00371E3C37
MSASEWKTGRREAIPVSTAPTGTLAARLTISYVPPDVRLEMAWSNATTVEVRERQRAGLSLESGEEQRFDVAWILVRWKPCDEELGGVTELPDIAATPMTYRSTSTMVTIFIKALA